MSVFDGWIHIFSVAGRVVIIFLGGREGKKMKERRKEEGGIEVERFLGIQIFMDWG